MNSTSVDKNLITPYQSFAYLYYTILGVGVFILPNQLPKVIGNDGIWMILLFGIYILLNVFIMTKLCQIFPNQSISEFSPIILGVTSIKWLGKILTIPILISFVGVWLINVGTGIRLFGEVSQSAVYTHTPINVFVITILIFSAIAASSGPEIMARFNEFSIPLILFTFIFYLLAFGQRGDIDLALPLLQEQPKDYIGSLFIFSSAITNYGVILYYSGYYQKPKVAVFSHSIAVITIIIYLAFIYFFCICIFGKEEMAQQMWPILEMVKVIHIPLIFFERLELALFTLGTIMICTSLANLYTALVGTIVDFIPKVEKRKARRYIAWIFIFFAYPIAVLPDNLNQLFWIISMVGKFSIIITLFIPLLLLVIAKIRHKKGDKKNASDSL